MSPAMAGSPYAIGAFPFGGRKVYPVPVSPLVRYQDIADAQSRNQALLMAMQVDAETTLGLVDRERYIRDFLAAHGFKASHMRASPLAAGQGMQPLFDLIDQAGRSPQEETQ